jgi:hypothetical protein
MFALLRAGRNPRCARKARLGERRKGGHGATVGHGPYRADRGCGEHLRRADQAGSGEAFSDDISADRAEDAAGDIDKRLADRLPLVPHVFLDPTQTG